MLRVCSLTLGMREGKFKDKTISQVSPVDLQELTFKCHGLVGESVENSQEIIIYHDCPTISYNSQIDLELVKDYVLVTMPLKQLTKEQFYLGTPIERMKHNLKYDYMQEEDIKPKVIAVLQFRLSLSNYKAFKMNPLNREILDTLCNFFTSKLISLS